MLKNKVQFQRGMDLREFMGYGTPEQCEVALPPAVGDNAFSVRGMPRAERRRG